ncbi:MAG: hypothetical protein PVI90_09705 [Desulfobacteraceae bacterium]
MNYKFTIRTLLEIGNSGRPLEGLPQPSQQENFGLHHVPATAMVTQKGAAGFKHRHMNVR